MLSDDIDKKIKEAAEQHHPAYDEKAWQKMANLLNQHLPQQKDDKRRIIFFLLLFLLIGGGAFMLIAKPWNKKAVPIQQLVQDNKNRVQANDKETTNKNIALTQPGTDKTNKEATADNGLLIDKQDEGTVINKNITEKKFNGIQNKIKDNPPLKDQVNENNEQKTFPSDNSLNSKNNQDKNITANENTKENIPSVTAQIPVKSVVEAVEEKKEENKINNQELTKTEEKKPSQKNRKSGHTNEFSFFVSAGPDLSKAGNSKMGKTTLAYGAGVGYTRNRFTLRTGIYTAKKIYWAGSNDYQLAYTPPPNVKFEGADANCSVLEIPVKLSYNFAFNSYHGVESNWFASAGLSSYLMKKEKYIYTYKSSSGPYYYPYETKNENKHYFSILNLSAGYFRRLNNTFSISVEPYAEIPLTGIGVGKVHLNSGGVLFSIGISPFKK